MIKTRHIILFLVITTAFFLFMNWKYPVTLDWICREDSLEETSCAIMYFIASLMFIYLNKKEGFKNIWYWGYFLLFFWIAGEEVSWGQRIFNIATPENLSAINVQHETNLHNLQGIHQMIRAMAVVVIFGICYAIPLTDRYIKFFKDLYQKVKMPVFPLELMIIPVVAILYMVIPRVFMGGEIFNWDEWGEWYLSVTFFLFPIILMLKKKEEAN